MRLRSIHCFAILSGVAILSSCSRPAAYFQPVAREPFAIRSQTNSTVSKLIASEPREEFVGLAEPKISPVEPVVQAKQAVHQLEAYVSNNAKLSLNRKVAKRLVRINQVLNASTKPSQAPSRLTATNTAFMERTLLKKIDKKVRQHLSPNQPKALSSTILLGLVIALVGLLLVIIASGFLNALGIVALVVGIGLILYTYLTK